MFHYDQYNFDPNKKYLIYFRGCFSIPHRGHFYSIQKYVDLPNVRYFIHQIGERHEIPYEINEKILKIYISYINKEKIKLKKMGPFLDVLDYIDYIDNIDINQKIDTVILLKGIEFDNKDQKESFLLEIYDELIQKLKKRKINTDFLFIARLKINTLSATKFVETLKEYKIYKELTSKKLRSKDLTSKEKEILKKDKKISSKNNSNIEDRYMKRLRYFVPKEISEKDFRYIIKLLNSF